VCERERETERERDGVGMILGVKILFYLVKLAG
jgi:hypothetical protein